MMNLDLLALPSFLLVVLSILWLPVVSTAAGLLKWWRLCGPRNDLFAVTDYMVRLTRTRVRVVGERRLDRRPGMVYLPNHRSFADFFLDPWLTEGRAVVLSRLMVALGFPVVAIALVAQRSVVLFQRGGRRVRDREGFNAMLDAALAKSPHASFLVYPEGHRSLLDEPLTLKTGMLKYAYSRRMPVQTVISANKEAVCSERQTVARFGQTVVTGFGETVDPGQYPSFEGEMRWEEFMAEVQRVWDAEWVRVLSASPTDGTPLPPAVVDMQPPLSIRLQSSACSLAATAACAAGLLLAARLALRLAAWQPLLATLLAGGLATWCAASYAVCSRPYKPPPPAPRVAAAAAAATSEGVDGKKAD